MAVLTRGHSRFLPLDENSLTTVLNSFRLPLQANTTGMPGVGNFHDNLEREIGLGPAQASTTDEVNFDRLSSAHPADVDDSAVINEVSGDSDAPFNLTTMHSLEHRRAVGEADLTKKPAVRARKQPKQKQGRNGLSQVSHPPGLETLAAAAPICLLCGKHLSGFRTSFCRRCDSKVYGKNQHAWNADL
jgi:hypothetical protein